MCPSPAESFRCDDSAASVRSNRNNADRAVQLYRCRVSLSMLYAQQHSAVATLALQFRRQCARLALPAFAVAGAAGHVSCGRPSLRTRRNRRHRGIACRLRSHSGAPPPITCGMCVFTCRPRNSSRRSASGLIKRFLVKRSPALAQRSSLVIAARLYSDLRHAAELRVQNLLHVLFGL